MKRFQYAKWLRRLWLRGACSKASRQPRTALTFESLEERTVPSILFSSTGSRTITDSGGPILQSMQVDLIFWGSGWNSGNGPTERTNVRATMNNILNSTYFDGLAQYRGIGHGTLFREDLITASSPGSTFQTAANGDLATMVANNINNGTLPSPNGRILYFVVPQPGSTPSDCGCGGRHLAGIASNNRVFPYGLVSNPTSVSVDSLSLLMSHELAEAATNPEWNITINGVSQAAFHVPGSNGDEIGDGEPNSNEYAMRLNGSLVQAYLSQRDHAYIVTNGSTNNFTVSSAGILSFQESFGGNNSIEVNRVNNGVYVTLNSSTAQFEPSSDTLVFRIRGIQVNALSGDGISVYQTGADGPVTVNLGSGTESISVGPNLPAGLGAIQGSITVHGGSGTDFLDLYDNASNASNVTYSVSASSVTRGGMAPINFSGQSHLNLTLLGSHGADLYNVSSTQAGSTTTVTAEGGNSTVNVEATSGSLTVNLTGSNNRVNVTPSSRNLDRINGAISVHGAGSTSLTVNDSAKAFISPGPPGAYFVTGSSIQRALTAAISYQSLSQITLDTGFDASGRIVQVSVTGTAAGATTSVVALGGLNLIDVEDAGHTLNGLRGDLSVTGAGVTQLFVVDSGERFPTGQVGTYTVTGNSVQRAGTGAVRYSAVTILNVSTGAYFNNPPLPIFTSVTGTSAPGTTVTAQPSVLPNQITVGDSARTLNGIRGALTLNGANFSQLTVDDHGTSTGGNSYTLANNSVNRAGTPAVAIGYSGMITTTVNAANAANTIEVTGTAGAQATSLDAGGDADTVNVRATSAPLSVTFHSILNRVAIGSTANTLTGIQGAVTLAGSSAGTDLTVHDEGGTSGPTYTVTNAAIGWGGPASISYSNVTSITLNGGRGGNMFNVESIAAVTTTTTINTGSGTNRINLTPTARNLNNLAGLVNINGQGGTNTLNAFDQATTFSQSLAGDNLYRDHLTRGDATVRTVFTFGGIQSINVFAGRGDNGTEVFGVISTPAGVPVMVTNAGTSTSYVEFFMGNSADSLQDIQGSLTIHGRLGGTDFLELVDGADGAAESYTLNAATGTGAGIVRRSGVALISFDNQTQQILYASPVPGTLVNVQSTSAGVVTAIVVQGGVTVTLGSGGTLAGLGRLVGISTDATQQPPTVILDDSADTTSRQATFTTQGDLGYGVSGLAGPDGSTPITWGLGLNAQINVQVLGGSGGNTFSVQSGLSGTALTLTGGSGSNTLIGSNSGNSWEVTGADTGVLSGSAYPNPVVFQQVGNLMTGSGGDYFLVDDQATLSGNLTGGGSGTLDYSPYSTTVLVDLQTGVATGVGGSVSGLTTVLGGNGNGAQAYNLLIGNGGDTLIGGFGRSNILVAGGSASTLTGGDSNDLLIGGTTVYDTDPALTAWQQIAAYWAGTDGNTDDYATRVANLMTGNGVPLLDATTVTGNGGGNTMTGTGELALIYTDGQDNISGFDPNSTTVSITP